jgi:hypothetical protein
LPGEEGWSDTNPEHTGGVPGTADIQIFAVVRDEDGVGDIQVVNNIVYHPDGTQKWKTGMDQLSYAIVDQGQVVDGANKAQVDAAVAIAVASGQISQTVADDLLHELWQREAYVYWYQGTVDSHQPSCPHKVLVEAYDQDGMLGTHYEFFKMLGTMFYGLDFDAINYGNVKANTPDTVSGDFHMQELSGAAGTNTNPPTIQNLGTEPFTLQLTPTTMLPSNSQNPNTIDRFDAQFRNVYIDMADDGGSVPEWEGGETVTFSGVYLERCHWTKIDFSIEPGALWVDTYTGDMTITVVEPIL